VVGIVVVVLHIIFYLIFLTVISRNDFFIKFRQQSCTCKVDKDNLIEACIAIIENQTKGVFLYNNCFKTFS
jgi:hypothetical protein